MVPGRKPSLTGAVAAVTGREVVTTKNENVQNMLTGKVAGLRVVQNSSEPGSFDNAFDIRGLGNPLVVIDGVPRNNITRLNPRRYREHLCAERCFCRHIWNTRSQRGGTGYY